MLKLATFLENCQYPYELVLLEKASSFWIKTLLSIFESHPVSIHAKQAHYCFYLIIQCSKNASPELSKTIGSNFVEKSINILVQSNNQLSKNALICLNELITNYRSACSLHKAKIETFVLSKLDSDSDEVVEWASRCYAKLPYLHKNQSNTDMWYAYFKNMLKNANIILNDIFEDHQPAVNVNNRGYILFLKGPSWARITFYSSIINEMKSSENERNGLCTLLLLFRCNRSMSINVLSVLLIRFRFRF